MPTKKKNEGHGLAGGLVALATVAAAAGAYFLYGSKDATKNRKAVKSWALKAKAEVLEKLEKMKDELNEENYNKVVDTVMTKYQNIKDAHEDEIQGVAKELKGHWKNIKRHLSPAPKKKATKKTGTKSDSVK